MVYHGWFLHWDNLCHKVTFDHVWPWLTIVDDGWKWLIFILVTWNSFLPYEFIDSSQFFLAMNVHTISEVQNLHQMVVFLNNFATSIFIVIFLLDISPCKVISIHNKIITNVSNKNLIDHIILITFILN